MPFCVQCGSAVSEQDRFCGKCGRQQSTQGPPPPPRDYMAGISNKNAILFCYLPWIGWVAAIVVLASERFQREARVRFHAFQGLYLFAAWLMVSWVIGPALSAPAFFSGVPLYHQFSSILHLVIIVTWIFMLVKVSQGQDYRLPVIGDLADRSVSEQRP